MVDVFQEARQLVSAREVAELNGLHPNRSGFICCPLHQEKTGSLKLYDDGHWHCFGCNRGGSSIDLMAALYDLTPLDAVRRLNEDFHLGLPFDRQHTPQERTEAARAAAKRRELSDTAKAFEVWRTDFIGKLNAAYHVAHLALLGIEAPEDMGKLTPAQVEAIRWQPAFEYWANLLSYGNMDEQMKIFRERQVIQSRADQILNCSPQRFSAA